MEATGGELQRGEEGDICLIYGLRKMRIYRKGYGKDVKCLHVSSMLSLIEWLDK